MKHSSLLAVAAAAVMLFAACKEKKNTGDIITKKPVAATRHAIAKTGDNLRRQQVKWLGTLYTIEIKRTADPSLPIITEGADRYYDNRISVRVVRADGSTFFSREFTKKDFAPYVDQLYAAGALIGIVFDHAAGDNLLFAASVGSPDAQSDEFVPLTMKLTRQGTLIISQATQIDTSGSDIAPSELDEADGV